MSDQSNASCQSLVRDEICDVGLFKQLPTYLIEHARKMYGTLLMNGRAVQFFRWSIRWNRVAKKVSPSYTTGPRKNLEQWRTQLLNSHQACGHIQPVAKFQLTTRAMQSWLSSSPDCLLLLLNQLFWLMNEFLKEGKVGNAKTLTEGATTRHRKFVYHSQPSVDELLSLTSSHGSNHTCSSRTSVKESRKGR